MSDGTVAITKVPVYSIEGLLGLKNSSVGDKKTEMTIRRQDPGRKGDGPEDHLIKQNKLINFGKQRITTVYSVSYAFLEIEL